MNKEIENIENQFLSEAFTAKDYLRELKKIEEERKYVHKTIGVFDGSMLMMRLDLKQLSLFFDQFYIIDAERWLKTKSFDTIEKTYLQNRKELDWLIENELIKVADFKTSIELRKSDIYKREMKKLNELFKGDLFEETINKKGNSDEFHQRNMAEILYRMSTYKARIQSILLSQKEGNEAYPVIDNLNDLSDFVGDLPKAHVVNILLKKIPMPETQTPWEQIFDFRSDEDSKEKYLRVKRWLYKTATKEVKTNEMLQEIESLIRDYEKHMEFYKMKYSHGVIKTTVLTTMEFVENIVKLKWTEAAKQLFNVQNEKVKLLEAEMKAPGKELSYFVKLKKRF